MVLALWGCTNSPYPRADTEEKVLYRSFSEAPKTLDPAVAYTTDAHAITGLVCGTLLEYHYLRRPYELIPGLVREVPRAEADPDGTVRYRFEFYGDLLFQDDPCFERFQPRRTRRLVAGDAAFALLRLADPDVNSPVLEPFSHVAGFLAFRQRLAELRKREPAFAALPIHEQYSRAGGVSGVRTPSETTLELVLERPYPQILYWFALPFTSPMPWEAVVYYDGREGRPHLADHPVGSGPYRLSYYDKQSRVVLTRNPNWHGVRHPEWRAPGAVFPAEIPPEDQDTLVAAESVRGQPLPFIERIELRREKEDIPAFGKFLQGYYDASGIISESFDKVVHKDELSPEMQARGMRLRKTVEPSIFYLGFNMDDATVGVPGGERARKLRQAMSLVVDAEEFTRVFLNGRGLPAQWLLPPGLPGYEAGYRNPYRTVDLEGARRLLGEAGYRDGVDQETQRPLRLTFDTGDTSAEGQLRYTFFINAWRRIGIDVELRATNYNSFQQKMRDGAFQVFFWGWVADYPDPENFMFLLWSKMSRKLNNGPNTANFKHARYDQLFLQMKAMDNTPERFAIVREMRGILEDQCPWIPLFHSESYSLYHGWLKNVKPFGMSIPMAQYYDLDLERRARERRTWNEPVLWPAVVLCGLLLAILVPGVVTFLRERQ